MKKSFLIDFTTPQGMVSSASYFVETEQEAIDEFRADFGSAPVIEYCEEGFMISEDYDFDGSMDGDAGSALASAGWGTDEDYGSADEVM